MPRKIGVVDDSVTIRTAFDLTFSGDDVGVDVRGFAAPDEIARSGEKFDLVIVDSKLANGMDGYEVCGRMRTLPQFAGTPLALLHGPWDPYDEARARTMGISAGFQKPWDCEDMINKVQGLMAASAPAAVAAPAPAPSTSLRATTTAMVPPSPVRPMPVAVPPGAPGRPAAAPIVPAPPGRPGAAPIAPAPPGRPAPVAPPPSAKQAVAPAPARPAAAAYDAQDDDVEMEVISPMPLMPRAPENAPAQPEITRGALADLAQMDNMGRPIAARVDGAVSVVEEQVARQVEARVPGISADQASAVAKIAREVIESVAWEVVPDLAEAIIREQIRALTKE